MVMSKVKTDVSDTSIKSDEKEKRRIQNEALASFLLKLTDKAQKYRSASISDQSKIKLACWDTFMQSISDAIRCLEHMHVLGGPDKEQEIEGMVEWARKTGEGNLLLNRSASEEMVESLLKSYAIEPKDETGDAAVVAEEEKKEEFTEEEKEEIEIEEEEDSGEIKPLEPLQPLQPLQLQEKDSNNKEEVPAP